MDRGEALHQHDGWVGEPRADRVGEQQAHPGVSAGPLGTVTLRLGISAVLMLAFCRPTLRGRSRDDWLTVVAFGAALAGMNSLFYQAIDRIPLGTAVTLEVLGPLALSVLTNRRLVSWLWAGLALTGVALLGGGLSGLGLLRARRRCVLGRLHRVQCEIGTTVLRR